MLTLTLLRHAKSSWETPEGAAPLADKDRPLSPRGLCDAPRMGRWMAAAQILPKLILCSTATRTRQTLNLILPEFKPMVLQTVERDDLYLASAMLLLHAARALPDKTHHAMFVGHDPGMHDLAKLLVGRGDSDDHSALRSKFPTASVAVIDFDVTRWSGVASELGRLRCFMTPKRLSA